MINIQLNVIEFSTKSTAIISHDQGIKTVVNELGLSLAIYDYTDNHYFEQIANIVVTESSKRQ